MIHLVLSMVTVTTLLAVPTTPYPPDTPTWERYAIWGFEDGHVKGTTVLSDWATGSPVPVVGGRIDGRIRMVTSPVEALVLDGRSVKVHLGDDPAAMLPAGNFSVEAWVVIDRAQQWGGIVSALQDNGASEQGWLLGFRDDRPCFALASKGADDGDGKMTYLVSDRPFEPGTLHHLLGTWDGSTMRLYMDGQPVGTSEEQSGEVLYPARAPVTLGSYEDDNEHYPMAGLLGRIGIWDRALGTEEVAWWYAESGPAPITETPLKPVASYDSAYLIPDGLDDEGKPFRPDPRRPMPLDGTSPSSIGRSFRVVEPGLMNMPEERFSIEALLSLDRVLPEGGVVAWADEDGRGWVLGQRDGHLGFALAGVDGERHWVTAPERFQPGQWYHVTASFDGAATRLHVNGDLVALSRKVIGSVQPPEGTPLSFGGRHRDDADGAEHGGVFFATLHNRDMSTAEIKAAAAAAAQRIPPSLQLRMSPAMKPLGEGRWSMTWETSTPGPSAIEWGTVFPLSNRVDSEGTGTRHEAILEDVPRDRLVRFQVVGLVDDPRPVAMIQPQVRSGRTPPPPIPSGPTTVEARSSQMSFDTAFDYSDRGKGYILVWGLEDGKRACALARRYDMQVIAIDEDLAKVRVARQAAEAAGLYGERVRVHQLAGETLPYAPYLFDYVTTERSVEGTAFTDRQNNELWRVLRPAGGVLDIDKDLLGTAKSPPVSRSSGEAIVDRHRSGRRIYRRAPLKETGTWTHQYGDAANTACSQDDLVRGDMGVLWWGRPGPRPMMDRGARTPAPLMAGHRMFIQANRQLIAVNAYNGAILWSLQIPGLRRVNVPRDCSNMVASLDDKLYVAIDDRLWVIDAETGERVAMVDVPVQVDAPLDWGFISRVDGHVLGTGVRPGSTYTGAEGEWYDGGGEESWRVTSDVLFSLDPADHDLQWSHVPRGRLLNSTITVDEGNVYYIEARSGLANGTESGRIGQASLREQYLVAVDLETGRRSWEIPIEVDHFDRMTYLLKSNGALVVVGTSDKFHVLVFNADDGSLRWQQDHPWDRDHHGGPLQHPVIFGNEVFVERLAYDLENGDITREGIPQGRGCGTKTASKHLVLFRHYFHSFWDPGSDAWTEWTGTRGGCWLGMLPVGGIVLAPESSSGCSCTHAIQTSMAFVPRRSDPTFSRIEGED